MNAGGSRGQYSRYIYLHMMDSYKKYTTFLQKYIKNIKDLYVYTHFK